MLSALGLGLRLDGAGFHLDASQFGVAAALEAVGDLAGLEARRKLQEIYSQVVREDQGSRAQRALVEHARQELNAADEASTNRPSKPCSSGLQQLFR